MEPSNPAKSQSAENADGRWWAWLAIIVICAFIAIGVLGTRAPEDHRRIMTVNDIRMLSIAIEIFKDKFGIYPPSRIVLSNDALAGDPGSLAYLSAIWPRINWSEGIDWSGGVPGFKSAKLEGDQCLVYFLAGPNGDGFSSNPKNPTQPGGRRIGPFFEFAEDRLVKRAKDNPFPCYQDGHGKNVYAFFSIRREVNRYGDDCPSLKVAPYFKKGSDPIQYFNRHSFQIISAGKDGIFGPGGAWAPESAAEDAVPNGLDDQSNFYGDFLGK